MGELSLRRSLIDTLPERIVSDLLITDASIAEAADTRYETFRRWLAEGQRLAEEMAVGGLSEGSLTTDETLYLDLFVAVERARQSVMVKVEHEHLHSLRQGTVRVKRRYRMAKGKDPGAEPKEELIDWTEEHASSTPSDWAAYRNLAEKRREAALPLSPGNVLMLGQGDYKAKNDSTLELDFDLLDEETAAVLKGKGVRVVIDLDKLGEDDIAPLYERLKEAGLV